MAKSYRRTDLPVEFIAVKNAGHDSEPVGDDPVWPSVETIRQRTIEFFKRYLISDPAPQ